MPFHVTTANGTRYRFAVLIPSRGRAALLAKTFRRMPFLINTDTWIGIQYDQLDDYRPILTSTLRVSKFNNDEGSVGIAREYLRSDALASGANYDFFVMTDDNAKYTEDALYKLVRATAECQRIEKHPVFMAGMHGTAPHFDRGAIEKTKHTVAGLQLYRNVGAIFHCVDTAWMASYEYPPDCFALEDRHLFMTAISRGDTDFRICMDAPFTKTRYQEGGQGDIKKRMWNCGRSIERLARDFPEYVGAKGTFPTPWQFIISMANGATADRLVGGAMRKGESIARQVLSEVNARHAAKKAMKAKIKRS